MLGPEALHRPQGGRVWAWCELKAGQQSPGWEMPSLPSASGPQASHNPPVGSSGGGDSAASPRADAGGPASPTRGPHLVQPWLVQLLLLDAQLADPGQQLPGLDEEAGAQQEGEDVGFLGTWDKVVCVHQGREETCFSAPPHPPPPGPKPVPAPWSPHAWWRRAHSAVPHPRAGHPPSGSGGFPSEFC